MMKYIFLFIIFISSAVASDISDAFQNKDYKRVSDIYRDDQSRDFTKRELIYISYSLRELKFFRQDIKLNVRLIKKNYADAHRKLLKQVANSETVDGEEYPDALKVLYWNLMNDYGRILESYKDLSTLIKKDHQHYLIFSKLLSELEFRESKVDKFNDQIIAYINYLEKKVYKSSLSLSFQYISWQTTSSLQGINTKTSLLITNRGLCVGGDAGIENAFYHFYVDGCVFAGSGGVSSDASSPIKYEQSNVTAYGAKFGPGASMIVSPSGSRIGLRLPLIYTFQKLQEPANSAYNIKALSPLSVVASLYSRWQFQYWYFQTEFGKYLQTEQTYWGLGIGTKF
jgi:hypothetical protein